MAVIPFNSKFKKYTDIEICNGFMSSDTGIMTKFYRECRIPFEKVIRSTYGRDSINNVMTIDDIYSVSFTRLIDRFQRKFFVFQLTYYYYRRLSINVKSKKFGIINIGYEGKFCKCILW